MFEALSGLVNFITLCVPNYSVQILSFGSSHDSLCAGQISVPASYRLMRQGLRVSYGNFSLTDMRRVVRASGKGAASYLMSPCL